MLPSKDSITEKAKLFAIRIIKLYQYLTEKKKEFVLSKQVLRSGTSIGANRTEAVYAYSGKDFLHKNEIALGECAETLYWLELLEATGYITTKQSTSISSDCEELLKLFVSIVKSLKQNLSAEKTL